MGPQVIVDASGVKQGPIERRGIINGVLEEQPLHRADQPFDTAVLPGAAGIAVLQANPQEAQCHAEAVRRKDGFVIGAQEARAAILTAHGDEMAPGRPRRLVGQPLHAQAGATRVVHDGQHDMLATVGIGLCR